MIEAEGSADIAFCVTMLNTAPLLGKSNTRARNEVHDVICLAICLSKELIITKYTKIHTGNSEYRTTVARVMSATLQMNHLSKLSTEVDPGVTEYRPLLL